MASYLHIAETIQSRIHHGDYRLREFPSGLKLAAELGVHPKTVDKALTVLLEEGILDRSATGRFTITPEHQANELHLVFLTPAFPSLHSLRIHQLLDRLTQMRGWRLRPASYVHYRDPVIADSLRGFDAAFILPGGKPADHGDAAILPAHFTKEIKESGRPVVMLYMDSSPVGIPCVDIAAATGIRKLLDAAFDRQHRQVDCLNTQPVAPIIQERIDQWQLWRQMRGVKGELLNDPVAPFGSAMEKAYHSLTAILKSGKLAATAIFCTTGAAAIGAMRALTDHGLEPGRDLALCAADDDAGQAPYLRPSLTCLTDPDTIPYLEVCLDWIGRGGPWVGPLCIHPLEMPVLVGESTQNYRKKAKS